MIWYDMIYDICDMMWYDIRYDMIYLTAIGSTPSCSSTVHIYTQTVHGTTQLFLVKEKFRTALIYNYRNEVNKTEGMNND
jgi:uncharacterized integral membrane protein